MFQSRTSLLFGADKKRKRKGGGGTKAPSLFERMLAQSAPPPPPITVARFSGTLASDDDNDAATNGARRLTYVGFSVTKIRQELFQCWLSDQPDAAQYRCADLVAAGAVESVFLELVRIACCCAPVRPRLFLEVVRVRRELHTDFLGRQHQHQKARAMGVGFGGGGAKNSSSSSSSSWSSSSSSFGAKKKRKPAAAAATSFMTRGSADADGSESVDWFAFRNDAGLRRALSRLVLLAYLSVDETVSVYAPPPFVPQDEFDVGRLRCVLEADGAHYGNAVLRREDSPKVHVAANELVFHLLTSSSQQQQTAAAKSLAGQHTLSKVCYWMQWLVLRKELVCAERSQFCGGSGGSAAVAKVAVHPVWIVWDALYHAATTHHTRRPAAAAAAPPYPQTDDPSLLEMLDALCAEYARGYRGSTAVLKQRMHILYCGARLALFGADWSAPLVRGDVQHEVDARIDYDTDRSYRLVQHEKAKVDAARADNENDGDNAGNNNDVAPWRRKSLLL